MESLFSLVGFLFIEFSLYLYAAQPTMSVYKKLKKGFAQQKSKRYNFFLFQQHLFELVIYTAQFCRLMYCSLLFAGWCTAPTFLPAHVLLLLFCMFMYCSHIFAGSCTAPTFLQAHVLLPPLCRLMYCSHLSAGSYTAPSFLQAHVLLPPFCKPMYCSHLFADPCTAPTFLQAYLLLSPFWRSAIMRTPGNCRSWKLDIAHYRIIT